jgi:diketogulonate reductase-like aldo/keto reductase
MNDDIELSPDARVELNDGNSMPLIGLGTWGLRGETCYRAVREALDIGYRLIDTAPLYHNEEEIGRALRDSGIDRDEVFLTTKVGTSDMGYESAIRACQDSLGRLGVDQVDLYLIHWPSEGKNLDTWKALEQLRSRGLVRSIGVSNFTVPMLDELLFSARVVPAVNQIEINPFVYDRELVRFCSDNRIHLEAYSPLTRGNCLQEKEVLQIANAYERSPAQILLRWALQKGLTVIPKATSSAHLRENYNIFDFELYFGDMDKLDALNTVNCLIDV